MIEEYRGAKQRQVLRVAIKLWRKAEADQQRLELEKLPPKSALSSNLADAPRDQVDRGSLDHRGDRRPFGQAQLVACRLRD